MLKIISKKGGLGFLILFLYSLCWLFRLQVPVLEHCTVSALPLLICQMNSNIY